AFGSLERLMGVLIEHYAGAFPLWMAPVQVAVAPISDAQEAAAAELAATLERQGYRVHRSFENEPIGARIRRVRLGKTPYMAILGARGILEPSVAGRAPEDGALAPISRGAFLGGLRNDEVQRR